MALKLNVGLSKKIGQSHYGSLGASCHIEIELDQSLLLNDLDGFHNRVRQTFIACRQAVYDELARERSATAGEAGGSEPQAPNGDDASDPDCPPPPATPRQKSYARKLAGRINDFGRAKLESYCGRLFSKPLEELSSREASALIDSLKEIESGRLSLGEAEKGVAA